jgi:hypothetical protein
MDIDHTQLQNDHLQNRDEAWITKYRAAMNEAPPQLSRMMKIRVALRTAQEGVRAKFSRFFLNESAKTEPVKKAQPEAGAPLVFSAPPAQPAVHPAIPEKTQTPKVPQTRKPNRAQTISKPSSDKTYAAKLRPKRSG